MNKFFRLYFFAMTMTFTAFFVSCSINDEEQKDSSKDNSMTSSSISKDFWGTWIRMDNGDVYNINDRVITINEQKTNETFPLSKESKNILKYGSEENAPRLFRKGGSNINFTAQLSGFEDSLSRAVSIGNQNIVARRRNKNNESDNQVVKSDSNGVISFSDAVSDEVQNIEISTADNTKLSVDILPKYDGENIGTIPLITKGKYALKTTYNIDTQLDDYMYGNDYTEYDITLKIENISEESCTLSFYEIFFDDPDLKTSFPKTGNIKTLLPGNYEELKGKISYGKLEEDYKDVTLNIKIEDGYSTDTWIDSVIFRFYRGRVPLVVNAQVVSGSNNANLNGFIIYPDSRSKRFSVKSGESSTIWMPYSKKDYVLVFSGATIDSEMKYSFNFRNPSKLADISGTVTRDEIKNYEPNNTFETASNIGELKGNIKAALSYGDLDYYKINNKNELIGNITSIKVDSSSMKTSYYLNQKLNTNGLVVKAVYQGGQEVDISNSVKIDTVDMSTTGTKSIEVSYTEDGVIKSEKIYITVKDFSAYSIEITQKPTKLIYYTKQKFDSTGINIIATTSDGEKIDVTNSVEYSDFDNTKVGNQTITVKLEKSGSRLTVSFDIEMRQLILENIRIDSKPLKTHYYTGQKFKKDGLTVSAEYNSGEIKDCTENIEILFDSNNASDSYPVIVKYTEDSITKTTTFNVIIDSHPGTLSDFLIDDYVFKKTSLIKVISKKVSVSKKNTYREESAFYGDSGNIEILPFEIGKYEVTQELYKFVMGTNPSIYPKNAAINKEYYPVDFVNFFEAIQFCNKLSESMSFEPVYYIERNGEKFYDAKNLNDGVLIYQDKSRNGFRLPTEAEWEFAARGGDETKNVWNYKYAGSNDKDEVGLFQKEAYSSYQGTTTVGSYLPNALGLYDMSGNVQEWCFNYFLSDKPFVNKGKSSMRGGSWWDVDIQLDENSIWQAFYHNGENSDNYVSYNGFRLARSVQ